jgi:phosphate transport system protein
MQTQLHRSVQKLKEQLLALGAEIERAIVNAEDCLKSMDVLAANSVIQYDKVIDQHEVDIEEECLKILALYHPVALDLRGVIAMLKMNNDLERIGDLCKNIAEYVIEIAKGPRVEIPTDFSAMFTETRRMVRGSLDSLVAGDLELARQVCEDDDIVDDLNVQIIGEIRDRLPKEPSGMHALLFLISVSRSLERIADYATNIAEDVAYTVSGSIVRHSSLESND